MHESAVNEPKWFTTTHWTVVVEAGGEATQARGALEQLCRTYWYPLYVYARRSGANSEEAEDLTQGFFLHLLQLNRISRAQKEKGRFRTFLLAAMQNFLRDQYDFSRRVKRGGGQPLVSLDFLDWNEAEQRYALEPADTA